jgi:hypothetical protein
VNNSNTCAQQHDRFAFSRSLTADRHDGRDTVDLVRLGRQPAMVAREGDPAPGTVGAVSATVGLATSGSTTPTVTFQATSSAADASPAPTRRFSTRGRPRPVSRRSSARVTRSRSIPPSSRRSTRGAACNSRTARAGLSLQPRRQDVLDLNFNSGKAIVTVTAPNVVGTPECIGDTAAAARAPAPSDPDSESGRGPATVAATRPSRTARTSRPRATPWTTPVTRWS